MKRSRGRPQQRYMNEFMEDTASNNYKNWKIKQRKEFNGLLPPRPRIVKKTILVWRVKKFVNVITSILSTTFWYFFIWFECPVALTRTAPSALWRLISMHMHLLLSCNLVQILHLISYNPFIISVMLYCIAYDWLPRLLSGWFNSWCYCFCSFVCCMSGHHFSQS